MFLSQGWADCLGYADALQSLVAMLFPQGGWVIADHSFEENDALFDILCELDGRYVICLGETIPALP